MRGGKRGGTALMELQNTRLERDGGDLGVSAKHVAAVVVHLEQDAEALALRHRGVEQAAQLIVAAG
ncbi:MAG TPA: hypothetical protein VJT33_07870 [bacterium]|nr:hypothetical protein [bacterium]